MSVDIKNNINLSPNNETSPVPLKDEAEEINALSDNKVDVEIEPDVKSNHVNIQICSCALIFNCFSPNSDRK